jgi:hypothetical protein
MDKTPKKQWHQPELIVLVRGMPEESVLSGCRAGPLDPGVGGSNSNQGPGCGYSSCTRQCSSNQQS